MKTKLVISHSLQTRILPEHGDHGRQAHLGSTRHLEIRPLVPLRQYWYSHQLNILFVIFSSIVYNPVEKSTAITLPRAYILYETTVVTGVVYESNTQERVVVPNHGVPNKILIVQFQRLIQSSAAKVLAQYSLNSR